MTIAARCMACDKLFSEEELLIEDDLCKKCLSTTYEDDTIGYYGTDLDESDDNEYLPRD